MLLAALMLFSISADISAQEDFYFTLLDHWNWKGPNTYVPTNLRECAISISAPDDIDLTFSTSVNNGQNTLHVVQGTSKVVFIDNMEDAILKGVSIHSSGACYVNINSIAKTSSAETAIIPKRLLGKEYMVQGIPGSLIDDVPTYSQFTVVGVETGSTVRVRPRVDLTCVTTNENIPAGQTTLFPIDERQVLLFQPVNYADDVTGTMVESDRKIAVFQGNTIARYPTNATWSDNVFEQARPISSWGKEFIIPKCAGLMLCDWKITVAEDNTEVYIYDENGTKERHVKNAGEWFTQTLYSASSDLVVRHIETSKPVCCYLYLPGSSANNDKGDPAMIEIAPVDNMVTEARWGKTQTSENAPHTLALLVVTRLADETKTVYNNYMLSACASQSGVERVEIDGFVAYQIPFTAENGALISSGEGFSAHIIHYAKTAEGSGYSLSLPEEPQQTELCMEGTLLFREDFGGNDPSDPEVITNANEARAAVPGMSADYTPCTSRTSGISIGNIFLVTKYGYQNGNGTSQWHLQDDHTHFGDITRGYFLEIDGAGDSKAFYSTTIDGLCEGSKLTFSAYVANVMTWGMYMGRPGMYAYPRLKFVLTDPSTDTELATYDTGDIPFDSAYINDPMCWQQSAEWRLVGMNFTVPAGQNRIKLTIYNNATGATGNDFAIDDIEIHLCAPPVTIEGDAEVCTNAAATLRADFTNDGTFAEPLGYKWWFSADSLNWTELSETTNVLSMPAAQKADSGWYKVAVAGADNIESVNCRAASAPFLLNVKTCEQPPVQPAEDLCTEGILLFREDFGGNDPNDPRVSQDPVPGMTYEQALTDVWNPNNLSVKAGKYIVTKSGYCNGDTASTNTPNNRRSQWFLQDDHTYPGDYTRGYFMEVDGKEKSDGAVFYTTTIDGLCEGVELSCLAYVANVQMPWYYENQTRVYPRLLFTLLDPADHSVLKTYDTGDIPYDSTYMGMFDYDHSSVWRRVGMTFTVPSGVNAVQLQIANNADDSNGNDFALDDIEVRLCMPPIHIKGVHQVCAGDEVILDTETDYPYMVYEPLYYEWWYSTDNRNWTKTDEGIGHYQLHIPSADASHEGWYKVVMGTEGRMDSEKCHTTSEWFHLKVQECQSPVAEESYNELVCDTLLPMTWHDIEWTAAGTTDFMLTDRNGDDSVHVTLTLDVQTCCPDVQTVELDSIVCGYLLPFTWELEGHFVIFGSPEVQEVRIPHSRWPNCTQTVYSLSLDTVHCDLLYPIIVNKYNWVLLVDNAKVRELFPERTVVGYQWYKDEQPISGATGDDYSETNELHGVFQMYLTLDGGDVIRSNIIDLSHTPEPQSAHVRAYNSSGVLICQWDTSDPAEYPALPAGIYLLRIEQGETCLSRKIIVL